MLYSVHCKHFNWGSVGWFLRIACPQQGDPRLSGPPSGGGAGGGARTRDRRVPADLRADSLVFIGEQTVESRGFQQQVFHTSISEIS
ncbi:hypothetical protein PoB_000621800 [Plakobranchus ocellatus]|uniref:Uncharacterized protein n=1 Tax=Plakobranchus ocellatus TaxID=259542 RepID=A0AAV3YB43_9GAST|nr:hypothetical protein PoB_000621800 [Plakobranchus ocellatus]